MNFDMDPRDKADLFKLAVLVVFVLIFGAGLAYCTSANALTIPRNQAKCEALAADVAYMTELRDQGVTWTEAEAQFRPQAGDVIGAKDSYIVDRQDFEYTMAAFKTGFTPGLTAQQAATIVYNKCMGKNKQA